MGHRSDLACVRKLRSGGASQGAPIGPGHQRERRWCGPLARDEGLWHGTHVWLAEASLLCSNSYCVGGNSLVPQSGHHGLFLTWGQGGGSVLPEG